MKKNLKKLIVLILAAVLSFTSVSAHVYAVTVEMDPPLFPTNIDNKTKLSPAEQSYMKAHNMPFQKKGNRVAMDVYLITERGRLLYEQPVDTSWRDSTSDEVKEQVRLMPETEYLLVFHLGDTPKGANGIQLTCTRTLAGREDGIISLKVINSKGAEKAFAATSISALQDDDSQMTIHVTPVKKIPTYGKVLAINTNGDYAVKISTKPNAKDASNITTTYSGKKIEYWFTYIAHK